MQIPGNIIVNADDFGVSSDINSAIAKCFELELINSTSIITNMSSFEEAIEISKRFQFQSQIGLHANLSEGKSLTDISKTKIVDKDGFFIKKVSKKKSIFFKEFEIKLIEKEIETQLLLLMQKNIAPTHINSHHHVHTLPGFAPIFFRIAKKYKLKLRIAQTWNRSRNPLIPLYRKFLNHTYKRAFLNFTDYFETFHSYNSSAKKLKNKTSLIEVMIHPKHNATGDIVDSYNGRIIITKQEMINANLKTKSNIQF